MKSITRNTHLYETVGPTNTNLQYLKSVFRRTLLPLTHDALVGFSLQEQLEAIPLGLNSVPEMSVLHESAPAGVMCGSWAGLLAIAFFSEEALNHFLAANPLLSGAIVTRLQDMHVVWLALKKALPTSSILDGVKLIAEGMIPVYAPPGAGVRCSIHQEGSILSVDPHELTFTGALKEFLVKWFDSERLPTPLFRVGDRVELNLDYWAKRLKDDIGLQYYPTIGEYVGRCYKTQDERVIHGSTLRAIIASMLREAREWLPDFPVNDSERRMVSDIMEKARKLCAVSGERQCDDMVEVLHRSLEERMGCIVKKEIAVAMCEEIRAKVRAASTD